MLGQAGIAQGHLERQGVGAGDVFLFFGLYLRCEVAGWSVFPRFDQRLVLTDPNGAGVSQ